MLFGPFRLAGAGAQGLVASLEDDRYSPDDAGGGAHPSGGGDDSPSSDDQAHDDAGPDPAQDAEIPDARADDNDDDDDDLDTSDTDPATGRPLSLEERNRKLQNAISRLKKRQNKTRVERQRLAELKAKGITLDDLLLESRQFRQLDSQLRTSAKLKKALFGGDGEADEDTARSTARRQPEPEFTFDDSAEALGFDPNDRNQPANRVIANGLRDVAMLKHQFSQLIKEMGGDPKQFVGRVGRIEGNLTQSRQQSITQEWHGAIRAAAAQIKDDGIRNTFQDVMLMAMEREGGKRPAKALVDHYLKMLKVNAGDTRRASAAAAQARPSTTASTQRIAERVQQLPRQQGQQGSPAPARQTRERVADVTRRIRQQLSGQ